MKILILLLVVLVAGCGATQPAKPEIIRVEVPVMVPWPPEMTLGSKLGLDSAARTRPVRTSIARMPR